jgi:hypothetical protein
MITTTRRVAQILDHDDVLNMPVKPMPGSFMISVDIRDELNMLIKAVITARDKFDSALDELIPEMSDEERDATQGLSEALDTIFTSAFRANTLGDFLSHIFQLYSHCVDFIERLASRYGFTSLSYMALHGKLAAEPETTA